MVSGRRAGLLAAICVLVLGLFVAVGCAADPEQEIRDQISADFDQVKNLDDEIIDELVGGVSADEIAAFEMFGLDVNDVVKAYFGGFDYSIDEVSVDGDAAEVTMTITCKTSSSIQAAMESALAEFDYASLLSDEGLASFGAAILDAIEGVEPTVSDPIVLPCERVDGQWVPTETATEAISAIVLG